MGEWFLFATFVVILGAIGAWLIRRRQAQARKPEAVVPSQMEERAHETQLAQRVSFAAESILENEALTADLDDAAAQALLDWGVACAEAIAWSTAGVDGPQVEALMAPRLQATRQLMRLVNRWLAGRQTMDAQANAALLDELIKHAAVIYGADYTPPDADQRRAFLAQHLIDPPLEMISHLRRLVEGTRGGGEADDHAPSG